MVEVNGPDLVLNSLETLPVMQTPPLCEIWNWQGDTSVLPYKFESVLNSASNTGAEPSFEESGPYSHTELK